MTPFSKEVLAKSGLICIVIESQGSFHLTQMLCHEACVEAGILCETARLQVTKASMEDIRERVLDDLARTFFPKAKLFTICACFS